MNDRSISAAGSGSAAAAATAPRRLLGSHRTTLVIRDRKLAGAILRDTGFAAGGNDGIRAVQPLRGRHLPRSGSAAHGNPLQSELNPSCRPRNHDRLVPESFRFDHDCARLASRHFELPGPSNNFLPFSNTANCTLSFADNGTWTTWTALDSNRSWADLGRLAGRVGTAVLIPRSKPRFDSAIELA